MDTTKPDEMHGPAAVPPRVTQDDVAREAGVTRSVVSYVLNNTSRAVAPETRRKVLEAIDRLGYRPNKFARGLSSAQSQVAVKQIGLVMHDIGLLLRPYYTEILAGIHAAAHAQGYHIRFTRFLKDLQDPILFNELIHPEEVGGLILLALEQGKGPDEASVERIRNRIGNIVAVEWQHPCLPSLLFDRQIAAHQATSRLLATGRRRIAYIGMEDNRIAGFRQALTEAGITDTSRIPMEGAVDMRSGYDAAGRLLANPFNRPDLIFAGSDEVSVGILRWTTEHGLKVPDDIALASVDNIEIAEFANPPLTTVNVQKAAMGRQAVDLLIRAMETGTPNPPFTITLPTNLVVRQSCP